MGITFIQERNYNFTDQQKTLHNFKKVCIKQAQKFLMHYQYALYI
jgi:hypothetical protein